MERFKLGLVGLNFGKHIVDQLTSGPGAPWFELAGVCDLDQDKAKAVAAQHGIGTYGSYAELLADPKLAGVALITGPNGRADLIRQALAAGKHVMTTKPFERDSRQALAVLREAREAGLTVHLNSPGPLPSADQAQILAWRRDHDLGRAIGARFETYASYHQQADGSWYDDPDRCPVAPIFRLGIYFINETIRLFGEPTAAAVMHSRVRTGKPTPDNAELTLRFDDGAIVSIYASFCVGNGRPYPNSLILHHEHGTITRNVRWGAADDHGLMELTLMAQMGEVPGQHNATPPIYDAVRLPGSAAAGAYQWEAFHRALRGEVLQDATTPEQVAAGIRVIEAMHRAEKSGRIEAV